MLTPFDAREQAAWDALCAANTAVSKARTALHNAAVDFVRNGDVTALSQAITRYKRADKAYMQADQDYNRARDAAYNARDDAQRAR